MKIGASSSQTTWVAALSATNGIISFQKGSGFIYAFTKDNSNGDLYLSTIRLSDGIRVDQDSKVSSSAINVDVFVTDYSNGELAGVGSKKDGS